MNVMAPKPVTREFALKLVKHVEDIFARGDVEAILSGYTDDIVIRFADIPEIRGKAAAEEFLRARFARQRNYRLRKDLRMLEGNMMGNYWDGEWEDAQTGKTMCGRGTEFWTIRDGKVSLWEATFNVWEKGGKSQTPIT
ncbi:MAG: nuclear transport factor 2 family protein [Rhodospirillales bacterium]|nr:nuclear transport factor 2 family protein [Rhodospirillales bacterium]